MQELAVTIERPLRSVGCGDSSKKDDVIAVDSSAVIGKFVSSYSAKMQSLCKALTEATEKINQVQQELVAESKVQMGLFAVEIAELIIKDKIEKRDYDIEKIISETVAELTDKTEIKIYINPEDYKMYEDNKSKANALNVEHLNIGPDPVVELAQCKVVTKNGVIESFLTEQLERISQAIKQDGRADVVNDGK